MAVFGAAVPWESRESENESQVRHDSNLVPRIQTPSQQAPRFTYGPVSYGSNSIKP